MTKPKCDACGTEQYNLQSLNSGCSTMFIKNLCDKCAGNANKIYKAKRKHIQESAQKAVKKYLKGIKK